MLTFGYSYSSKCFQLQCYLEARKHCQEFRHAAAEAVDKLSGDSQVDIISKHFQVVKLELEAVLKLKKWDDLDDLFEQCWKYKTPDRYETLADLVLVIHSCLVKADAGAKYQSSEWDLHVSCCSSNVSDRDFIDNTEDHQPHVAAKWERHNETVTMDPVSFQPHPLLRRRN